MNPVDRRTFLAAAGVGAAAFVAPRFAIARARNLNDELRVAVVGVRGRGVDHIRGFSARNGVRVVALCDVDRAVLDRRTREFAPDGEKSIDGCVDFRRLLDRNDVDAVSIATPNHWHALQTVWACQAGKDVYVEKPVSHSLWEGEQMVAAARAGDRIVQTGTQCRSSPAIAEAIAWVREGHLGALRLARGLCYKPRRSIGRTTGPQPAPASVDYDLWCGPASDRPLRRKNLHYDWHWVFETGNGDLGNQGIHQMDLCRWAIGADALPRAAFSFGGRFGVDDDGDTPNTLVTYLDYAETPIVFEVRGLPVDAAAQADDWRMDSFGGARIGAILHCEGGELRIPSYDSAVAVDGEGRELKSWRGSENHYANFVQAVKSHDATRLAADVREGELSSALCHLGNVSYLTGHGVDRRVAVPEAVLDRVGSVHRHLERNGVTDAGPRYGAWLEIDPATGRFTGSGDGAAETVAAANALRRRAYRSPFVVPELA